MHGRGGRKSTSDIVRDAHAYSLDNVGHVISYAIKRLAKTWSNIKHAERVVKSLLPTERTLNMEHIEGNCVEWVLLPYSTFHWLLKNHRRKSCIHMGAKDGDIQRWWEQL